MVWIISFCSSCWLLGAIVLAWRLCRRLYIVGSYPLGDGLVLALSLTLVFVLSPLWVPALIVLITISNFAATGHLSWQAVRSDLDGRRTRSQASLETLHRKKLVKSGNVLKRT